MIDIERKDFYVYKKPKERTRARLQEISDLGLEEVGVAEFGVRGIVSGLYIEGVWSKTDEQWADYIKWIKEVVASKESYYIVSIKHTSKGDSALTFWCANAIGYTWDKRRAGVYSKDAFDQYVNEDNIAVEKSVVDKFWMNADDFGEEFVAMPNNTTTLKMLGLSSKLMKPARFATCRMKFLNTPENLSND